MENGKFPLFGVVGLRGWKEGQVDVDIFHPNPSKAILSNGEEKFREKTNIS